MKEIKRPPMIAIEWRALVRHKNIGVVPLVGRGMPSVERWHWIGCPFLSLSKSSVPFHVDVRVINQPSVHHVGHAHMS